MPVNRHIIGPDEIGPFDNIILEEI